MKEAMKDTANSITNSVKKAAAVSPIREDLETLKEDALVLQKDAKILGRDLKEEGYKQLSRAEVKAKEALEEAKAKGKDTYSELATFVQNNPGQSVAIAFVGGIIASMLLGRR